MRLLLKLKWVLVSILIFLIVYVVFYAWILGSVKDTLRTIYLHPELAGEMKGSYVAEEVLPQFTRQESYSSAPGDKSR
ncbi:hypothetical protein [Paenibacillus sp. OV219]|uniref:hypothetical protein n=1 Tax=Paenibacillus sp. OV219 TaxID=1884377 RepID=UPI0008D5AC1B|nr:hypothetical protein [Paenibacillus sp. OV219]SEO93635.1 hypothetical protein SAMN05518847_11324 [Paenibacillus sp. OV219]